MFRHAIFAGVFAALFVLPGFSVPLKDRNGEIVKTDSDIEVMCNSSGLGFDSGNLRLTAIWNPNVYEFVLDDKLYTGKDDETGEEPTKQASYESVYSRYEEGIYGNVDGASSGDEDYKIEWISVPEKEGYYFMGFFTEKYSGGTRVIKPDGQILPAVQNMISENGTLVLYAQWTIKTYDCPAGQYWNKTECAECLDGSYCPGVNNVTVGNEIYGLIACDADAYYLHSDNGRTKQGNCYKEVSVPCATKNSYADAHGVVKYNNPTGYAICKQYYGNESDDCILTDEHACDIKELVCNDGYVLDPNTTTCVSAKIKCAPGTYLPNGTNECAVCLEDNYCVGTEYIDVFQDYDQGIDLCSNVENGGPRSPAGSKVPEDCGHILHIGDNDENKLYLHADKNTDGPSFVAEIDGKPWYGSMTAVDIDNIAKPISAKDGAKKFHIKVNGKEYTVHGRYVE